MNKVYKAIYTYYDCINLSDNGLIYIKACACSIKLIIDFIIFSIYLYQNLAALNFAPPVIHSHNSAGTNRALDSTIHRNIIFSVRAGNNTVSDKCPVNGLSRNSTDRSFFTYGEKTGNFPFSVSGVYYNTVSPIGITFFSAQLNIDIGKSPSETCKETGMAI